MSELLQSLSGAQLRLLKLIAEVQRDYGAAPVWSYLEHELDKGGMDAAYALSSLPSVGSLNTGSRHYGLVWIDTNIPMPATKVHITIAGRHRIRELVDAGPVKAFVDLLSYLTIARMRVTMSPIEVQAVYATRSELQKQAPDPNVSLFKSGTIDQIKGASRS